MFLKFIQLKNFKNYEKIKVNLNKNINVFYGNNAQGKTNLLESIYFLARTTSHRLLDTNQIIKNDKKTASVIGKVRVNNFESTYSITMSENKKQIMRDGTTITKISDYIFESLDVILFTPDDLDIIKGPPTSRRNFINEELSQLSKGYIKLLSDYNKLLKIRNDYLRKMQVNIKIDDNYFEIISNYLIDKGVLLYNMRKKFISKLDEKSNIFYNKLCNNNEFKVQYVCNFFENENDIKKEFKDKLQENYKKEVKNGTTLIGPHRDDLIFNLNNKDLKIFGSQGQQRAVVLSLKLAEIEVYEKAKNRKPLILLDDVFSELDNKKKLNLLNVLNNDYQVFITTTNINKLKKDKFKSVSYYKIKEGNITKMEEGKNE